MNMLSTFLAIWGCHALFTTFLMATAVFVLGCGGGPGTTGSGTVEKSESSVSYWCNGATPFTDDINAFGCMGFAGARQGKRPIVGFGLTKAAGEKARYACFFIFRVGELVNPPTYWCTQATTNPDHHDYEGSVSVGSQRFDLDQKFILDEDHKTWSAYEVKVGGKDVSGTAPRVFLIALQADNITLTPVNVDDELLAPQFLHGEGDPDPSHQDLNTAIPWVKGALATLEQLKQKSPEIKKFLE